MPLIRLLIIISIGALSACVSPSKQSIPVEPVELQDEQTHWWHQLEDPFLNELVHSGRESGLDVQIAETQIDENKALTRAEFAQLFPSIDLVANTDFTEFPDSSVGLNLNWQIDIFGSVRASVKAARLRGLASEAVVDDVRRLISSQIVSTYIQLRARQVELALAERSAERLEDSLARITRLADSGYATSLDVIRSGGQLTDISARIASLRGQERALQNVLRQLVSQETDPQILYETTVPDNFTFPQPAIPDPDPERLFVDRADIRAAALAVNAETYERISAKRALYPSISLDGNVGLSSVSGSVFSPRDISKSLVAGLVAPLLGRGRFLARVDAENAQTQRALLVYEQTILNAVTEVDTAQTQLRSNREAARQQQKALAAATIALEQSTRLFESGEISFLDVLVSEQQRIDSEQSVVLAEEAAALAWVQYMSSLSLK